MENNDDYVQVFARRLRHYINIKEKTQEQVAEYVGVSPATVSFWCKGARVPRMDKVDALCKFFGCSRDDLLTDNPKPVIHNLTTEDALLIKWYHKTEEHNRDLIRRMMAYENEKEKDTGNMAM